MNAPGSPSSPLQTMYFLGELCRRAPSHFRPAGNPPPPRPGGGVDDVLADLLIGHLEERLLKAGVAALGDILLDILGVTAAAVLQHHPVLLLIEGDIRLPGIGHPVQVVHQPVDDLPAQNGLLQEHAI